MIEKINKNLKIVILFIFAIAVVYFIILSIVNSVKLSNEKKKSEIDIDNISSYIPTQEQIDSGEKESILVTDYNLFYTIQDATENFLQYLSDGKFDITYNILSAEMKKKYTKEQYMEKVSILAKESFITPDDPDEGIFVNSNNLYRAYKIAENTYLCETKDKSKNIKKLGVKLFPYDKTYLVFYIEF